ncbi:copper resistance system multicopper oxidase [Reyranella soli]|jgi:CopA family copper-resistance protein|uniref:Copper oxidase n=1 Tax=Reyranella soli TaxID=1230389 RepID=A0A512NE89_9HYPH|nr:copper resistance system multicopper oxidase [Reyranella soli]GEP57267.1 copper oxidase [Reyranella soli]
MTTIIRALLAAALLAPLSAFAATYDLVIDRTDVPIEGQMRRVFSINGQIAGPTLRWKEGEDVTVNVTNRLNEDTSIHWHGVLLPYYMDGVPMVSFAGIKPGATFSYRFKVRQSGTYWYHSHSGGQEQEGMYAPIVIEPAKGERYKVARDYVVMFSDHHPMSPGAILRKLKQEPGYFNDRKRTLPGLLRDLQAAKTTEERQAIISDRLAWGEMRMDPTDLADVTGYTFLVNGRGPNDNWTGLFKPGEKVRLRFINGSAMTVFDARIPGLKLKVVQADGNDVAPVDVDEFRIGVGETYDVIVEPREDRAYTIEGQSIDRRGFARATLAPREGMAGPLPVLRPPGVLGMADMGHGSGGHGSGGHGGMDHSKMDHSKMDHAAMGHTAAAASDTSGLVHVPPVDAPAGAKVLSYTDLKRLDRGYALNPPDRTIDIRLTGNMEKFIWSFDDRKYSEQPVIDFTQGETVRLVFKNETMMNHPIHLHGLWMDLENGAGDARPRKHVVIVPPGRTVSVTVQMAEVGRWPFHCHFLFHMMTGMFREFVVHPKGAAMPAATGGGHAHH